MLHPVVSLHIDVTNKSIAAIQDELRKGADDVEDAIVALRLSGRLHEGSISDIGLKDVIAELYDAGAFFVMQNTSGIAIDAFEQIAVDTSSKEAIEDEVINEHAGQKPVKGISATEQAAFVKRLMQALSSSKEDGEKVTDFEERVLQDAEEVLQETME
jgi:hypothetical protein